MTHFETYYVHLYKQVTNPWTDEQADQAAELVEDTVLCGLLEAVTVLYLKQRGPLAADLIVGATLPYAHEGNSYQRPFMTATLDFDACSMLRGMLAELDAMVAVGECKPSGPGEDEAQVSETVAISPWRPRCRASRPRL